MTIHNQPSDEREEIDPEVTIERAFEFVRDVLDDPAVPDRLPARAELTITPIEDQRADRRYDAMTRRFPDGGARMVYALWDNETNNLVAEYGNQRDALALVLRGIERNGPHDTDTLSLDVEDETGRVTTIAHGQALAALAQRELARGTERTKVTPPCGG